MILTILSGSPRNRLIYLCAIANFLTSADRVIMPITILWMSQQFHWSIHLQGWILSSYSIGYITSQIIVASVSSKYGPSNVLALSIILCSFCTLLTPLVASNFIFLLIVRIIVGLSEGLCLPMIYQLFSIYVPISQRSRAFSYLISAGTIGQTISALITSHIYWPFMFYFMGLSSMIWIFKWFKYFNKTTLISDINNCCWDDLENMTTKNEVDNRNLYRSDKNNAQHLLNPIERANAHWSEYIIYWPLWAIYIAHFAMNWSNYIIMQWLPYYLSNYLSADKKSLSLTAIPYILNCIAGIGAGHLADSLINNYKWSILSVRRWNTCLALFSVGICMLIFSNVKSLWTAILIICMAMSFCALNSAGHLSNHTDLVSKNAGITFAISNTISTLPGLLCGPLTAELVTQSHGRWLPVFVLAAGINFVAAIIYASQSSASALF